jgi:hypothetical protein
MLSQSSIRASNVLNFIAKIRMRQAKLARRILPIFVAALLSTAIQPCAMAMGDMAMGDSIHSDCPHCPPAQMQAPCDEAGTRSDCDASDPIDTRSTESKFKDKPIVTAVVIETAAVNLPALTVGVPSRGTCSASHRGDPSLSIRYCVFLK